MSLDKTMSLPLARGSRQLRVIRPELLRWAEEDIVIEVLSRDRAELLSPFPFTLQSNHLATM